MKRSARLTFVNGQQKCEICKRFLSRQFPLYDLSQILSFISRYAPDVCELFYKTCSNKLTWLDCFNVDNAKKNILCSSNHIKVTVSWMVKIGRAGKLWQVGIFDLRVISQLSVESQNQLDD